MGVGDYDIKPFTSPVGTTREAYETRGNDNVVREKFVAHQADTVAHPTVGTYASRPVTGSEGQIYVATDAPNIGIYVYTGGSWINVASPDPGDVFLQE